MWRTFYFWKFLRKFAILGGKAAIFLWGNLRSQAGDARSVYGVTDARTSEQRSPGERSRARSLAFSSASDDKDKDQGSSSEQDARKK